MGSLIKESYEEFIDSIKRAGIEISNEVELRERLAEAQRWRYAFITLAANGKSLGIRFEDQSNGSNVAEVRRAMVRFEFPDGCHEAFAAGLVPNHSHDGRLTMNNKDRDTLESRLARYGIALSEERASGKLRTGIGRGMEQVTRRLNETDQEPLFWQTTRFTGRRGT